MVLVYTCEIELLNVFGFIKPHHNFANNFTFLCIKCISVYEIRYDGNKTGYAAASYIINYDASTKTDNSSGKHEIILKI